MAHILEQDVKVEYASKAKGAGVSNAFELWLDIFISEKGIDPDQVVRVTGPSGENAMPLEVVLEAIKQAPKSEQADIKRCLVKIDFINGDPARFLTHLAQAIAI